MDQVVKAFNGRYREVNRETQQWYTYNHPVPEPRPGMVSTCPLPSAGKETDCFLGNKSAAQPLLIFASILQHAHPSCLKWFLFIYTQSPFHYLVILSQQNQQKVNKSLSRCTGLIDMCRWLKCLPAQCITNEARKQGIPSSLRMPDKVLNFVKDHFLMDSVIRSSPLLLKRNAHYRQIAVHRVQTGSKVYHVLFIGTGEPLHSHKRARPNTLTKRLSVTIGVISFETRRRETSQGH